MALIKNSSSDDKTKHYFALRDEAAAHTGYSKLSMHTIAKAKIFPLMADDMSLFEEKYFGDIEAGTNPSLQWLTDKGLDVFTEAFKEFCQDNFDLAL